jgi:hypothetical protein
MHILPDLEAIECAFPLDSGLIVIGVHSAKFDNEKVSANIRNALLRYGIKHPVLNDHEACMWHQMSISCWPTLVLLAPDQKVLLSLAGEGHRQVVLDVIQVAMQKYSLKPQPLHLTNETNIGSKLFPSKICINATGERLALSDAVQHKIFVSDLKGYIQVSQDA